jgi:hypothetical protein
MRTRRSDRIVCFLAKYDSGISSDGDHDRKSLCTLSMDLVIYPSSNYYVQLVRYASFIWTMIGCISYFQFPLIAISTVLPTTGMVANYCRYLVDAIQKRLSDTSRRCATQYGQRSACLVSVEVGVHGIDCGVISICVSFVSVVIYPVFDSMGCKSCVYVLSESMVSQ